MASSSRLSCFHCQDASSNPDHFRNGWRLRSGEYAQLCPRCACFIFGFVEAEGAGGLCCVYLFLKQSAIGVCLLFQFMPCINFALELNMRGRMLACIIHSHAFNLTRSSVYEEGRFCETFHSNDDGWRDCESCGKLVHCGCIVSFNTHLLLDFGGIICMECSRALYLVLNDDVKPYQSNESSSNNLNVRLNQARNRCLSLEPEIRAKEPYQERTGQALLEAQCWRRVTDLDLQQVSRNPKATVTPLFEKILSASDADLKLARLIIPKRCAEAFFPDISALHGLHIKIQDTEGNEWEFHYRYWLNGGSRIYVLEGLRDYMVSKKWQPGDTVTFYRVDPGGKVVMGLRKTSADHQLTRHSIHFFPPESKENVYSRKRTTAAGTL
ncbi:UNVERIFIED_CONTAM: B3 domain-containing transcription repressor VAL1 [Sesamum radiatum]|uniref:B3 domain-containing transcription repressor VAL1 n=1 Tax=Sesamum radiatum TaxID=300843 RepID=A0AAW2K3K2_SESRA